MADYRRLHSEKKPPFATEALALLADLRENLGCRSLSGLRLLYRYDIEGVSDQEYQQIKSTIISEPPLDLLFEDSLHLADGERAFAIEYLPGQYDQRADSTAQCVQLVTRRSPPLVATAKVVVLQGPVTEAELQRIMDYLINPVDSRQASLAKPKTLRLASAEPGDVPVIAGFSGMGSEALAELRRTLDLAMDDEDFRFCQAYFRDRERRDPTLTEIRMLDTYWSDHCRHTTFLTSIPDVEIPTGPFTAPIRTALEAFHEARARLLGAQDKTLCLMDLAQIGMKELRQKGLLPDLDVSDEINACSVRIPALVAGQPQEWLLMFKNETHNHPTEIEPYGGAATCLGGAIRDPLSGRSWVFQAMRVTGSGDPRTPVERTMPGKLPQRKITREAARGYSAYGNQIGLATGQVREIYDPGYQAKRMEIGAVIGAAPRENVVRSRPQPGDVVLLVGGATGRDGIGGATGSSKAHTESSILTCGAEVQKGNPVIERKIQRLFRNPLASRLIKRCNDFGAGGVSVAVGELAAGVDIDLDALPKKYEGLDGTELALSESQERMAVVVAADAADAFRSMAEAENLEATAIARVSSDSRLKMRWRGQVILDIARDFLDSAGVTRRATARIAAPEAAGFFAGRDAPASGLKGRWRRLLADLNHCSQQGLVEQFDSSIGRGTLLFPFGGRFQATPAEGMAARLPVLGALTSTAAIMTFGFDPALSRWSPFHGGVYAVVEAVTKLVACGGRYNQVRLSLQEYFERLGRDPERWGKPLSALLGAYWAQKQLGIAAIGGKDSMSGTFLDFHVPPTLVAFAVGTTEDRRILSPEFKHVGSYVVWLTAARDADAMPDFAGLKRQFDRVAQLNEEGKILSAGSVRGGGLAAALAPMCFGNGIGLQLDDPAVAAGLFSPDFGSLVLEIPGHEDPHRLLAGLPFRVLGRTVGQPEIRVGGCVLPLAELQDSWEETLKTVFPPRCEASSEPLPLVLQKPPAARRAVPVAKPRVLITIFPGTNCEYDTAEAFAEAGADPRLFIFRNLRPELIEESIAGLVAGLKNSQILVIPGGFSAGDEPEGSGKFITAVLRNPRVKDAVERFLGQGDGLILGVCNGFQALIKVGLLPDGRIHAQSPDSPTLTFNTVGRHISRMVRTRLASTLSPWFCLCKPGDIHLVPISHGEGRFVATPESCADLLAKGQIAAQYVDFSGQPTMDGRFNPNGSIYAVEALSSPDGRILGKMGHAERYAAGLFKNIPGIGDQNLYRSGVHYFS